MQAFSSDHFVLPLPPILVPRAVVVALPEDMLVQAATVADALPYQVTETHPGAAQMAELQQRLQAAQQPVAIVGGSRWSAQAVQAFTAFAQAWSIPVYCSFRRQMLFPATHACYGGDLGLGVNPKLLARIKASDLVLVVGGRLSEVPSQGYELFDIPTPAQPLVHVHADADELGKLYRPTQAIHATPQAFAAALNAVRPQANVPLKAHTEAAHADYLAWSDPAPIRIPGALQMGEVMQHLRATLPADTIFCNGAGNFATWVHRFWPFTSYASQLAPTSGSMGYGLPAAVGAKRLWPQREVVVFAGDGDFLMHGQEFATAVQYGLPLIVVLLDNAMYGTIRMHQEREYPGRISATALKNPDFQAYAQAFGGHGERITTTEEFAPALARARASGLPSVLHCLIDPEAITPTGTLQGIRRAALLWPRQAGTGGLRLPHRLSLRHASRRRGPRRGLRSPRGRRGRALPDPRARARRARTLIAAIIAFPFQLHTENSIFHVLSQSDPVPFP